MLCFSSLISRSHYCRGTAASHADHNIRIAIACFSLFSLQPFCLLCVTMCVKERLDRASYCVIGADGFVCVCVYVCVCTSLVMKHIIAKRPRQKT